MSIPVKDRDTILSDLRSSVQDLNSNLNLADHSVTYDLSLFPASVIGADLFLLADFVNRTRSLPGIENILSDESYKEKIRVLFQYTSVAQVEDLISSLLDDLVGNWDITRNAATQSRGPVRVYFPSSGGTDIDAGTRVSTRGTSPIVYSTLSDVIGTNPQFDSVRGLYYYEIMCEAVVAGSSGNVATDRVVVIVDNIVGAVGCSNPIPISNGTAEESDESLIARARLAWTAWSLDTKPGLRSFLMKQPGVLDAYVAKQTDVLNTRGSDPPPVDVFVSVSSQPETVTDRVKMKDAQAIANLQTSLSSARPYPGTTGSPFNYIMTRQPVISVNGVSGSSIGVLSYTANLDSTSSVSGSTESRSSVDVTVKVGTTEDEDLIVEYTFDSRILSLQNTMDSPDYELLTADVNIRKADVLYLNITGDVAVFSEYTKAAVQTVIESDITKMLSGGKTSVGRKYDDHKLGERLDRTDTLLIALEVAGVDRMDTWTLEIDSTEITSSFQPKNSETIRIGTVTWL